MSVEHVLYKLLTGRDADCATAVRTIPAREARYADFPASLDPRLVETYRKRGVERLYTHQAQAIGNVLEGRHVVVVTPTASGKTLCYNLPVLDAVLKDDAARALYLFPTKALSNDQLAEMQEVVEMLGVPIRSFTYDGDTPEDARRAIRAQGHVVVTNPDMLHQGILPHHTKWAKLFENLRYVVVDELHTYRGVFGSHVANLIRRLKRVCAFYRSRPTFILCSATIANPKELAERLTELPVELVDDNGAPSGEKTIVLWNPPVVHKELGIRRSFLKEAERLTGDFVSEDVQTICFATSRLNVEILTSYLKERFEKFPHLRGRVRGYRGGYLPNMRREIEQGLRSGDIRCVVSTNALELGIDIGTLDACVMAGYPGTVASVWQQSGRAGRRSGKACAILIARSDPMDQYLVTNPDYFFGRSPEHGLVNPDNLLILIAHVKCAAFELPFQDGESFGKEDLPGILKYLEEEKILHHAGQKWYWTQEVYPADGVSLRSATNENFVVMDMTDNHRVIGEVDYTAAPETVHEEAVYLCDGIQYQVTKLDYEQRRAYVKRVDVDYYTDAVLNTSVKILDIFEKVDTPSCRKEHGEVHVAWRVSGFKKVRFHTRENVGFGEVNLPDQEMQTTSYWFTFPHAMLKATGHARSDLLDGVVGLAYLLHHLAPFTLMCDVRDIHRCVGDHAAEWFARCGRDVRAKGGRVEPFDAAGNPVLLDDLATFEPTVFLYDSYPGGVGFSPHLFDAHEGLFTRALATLRSCSCPQGCPSCVGPVNEVGVHSKEIARELLELALGDARP